MDLSNLKPAEGSVKTNKRLGRGVASGKGGTSTRGHKGANRVRVILVKSVLKAVRCLCNVACLNSDLRIKIE